jgi:hypothetical protein
VQYLLRRNRNWTADRGLRQIFLLSHDGGGFFWIQRNARVGEQDRNA